jgi:hypothetical protein
MEFIFEHPTECSAHCDAEGHILLHVLANVGKFRFPTRYPAFRAFQLQGRSVDAVVALLILSDEPHEIPPLTLGRPIDERCLHLMRKFFKRVTSSQFGILALLYSICGRIMEYGGISTEEVVVVSICVTKALQLPQNDGVIPITRPLVGRILDIQTDLITGSEYSTRSGEEIGAVSTVGMRCVDRLNTWLLG